MRVVSFFIISLIFTSLISCEYVPSGINPVHVERVDSVYVELNVSNYKDTIPIVEHTILDFDLDIKNLALYEMNIFIDDQLVNINGEKRIYLHPEDVGQGYHNLKVHVIISSGSGSLADNYNLETLSGEFIYVLSVDIDPPHAINITGNSNVDGMLRLTWERYNQADFSNYIIYKYLPGYLNPLKIFSGLDQNLTECFDDSYVGGICQYAVAVVSKQGVQTIGEKYMVDDTYPEFTQIQKVEFPDSISSNVYTLSWTSTNYYRGFKKYVIWLPADENIEIFEAETTSISLFDVPFGRAFDYKIETVPQTLPGIVTDTISCFIGEETILCSKAIFNPHNGVTYYDLSGTLGISKNAGPIIKYAGISLFDKVIITAEEFMRANDHSIEVYDNENLTILDEIPNTVFGDGLRIDALLSASDNGIIITSLSKDGRDDSIFVYNSKSDIVIGTFDRIVNAERSYMVTPDGSYILANDTLFEVVSDVLVKQRAFDANEINVNSTTGFTGNQEFYIVDLEINPPVLKIYDLSSLEYSEMNFIGSEKVFFRKVPFSTKLLVFEPIPFTYLYQLDFFDLNVRASMAQIKTFTNDCFLLEDSLVSSNGLRIKISGL